MTLRETMPRSGQADEDAAQNALGEAILGYFEHQAGQRLSETVAATHGAIRAAMDRRQNHNEAASKEPSLLEAARAELEWLGINPSDRSYHMTTSGITLPTAEGRDRSFSDLVFDYTGTLSLDGLLILGLAERLADLALSVRITVLTADTFGTAQDQLAGLPVQVRLVEKGQDKADFLKQLGPERVIAIGNGRNDVEMMKIAGLGIVVIGPEGAAGELLQVADVVVRNIRDALDLIANPLRLKATLRD